MFCITSFLCCLFLFFLRADLVDLIFTHASGVYYVVVSSVEIVLKRCETLSLAMILSGSGLGRRTGWIHELCLYSVYFLPPGGGYSSRYIIITR